MSVSENMKWVYGVHDYAVNVNLAGISDAESRRRMEPGGNCVNWIMGHMLCSRVHILGFLGCDWTKTNAVLEPYQRGTSGADFDSFLTLDELTKLWQESSELLKTNIDATTDEQWLEPASLPGTGFDKPDTRERRVFFLSFHEGYHLGQIGLLRRLLGKEGAIK
ncbi:MAG: DinB family protein [bacterium]|nr:DinB family protein [bacterium]